MKRKIGHRRDLPAPEIGTTNDKATIDLPSNMAGYRYFQSRVGAICITACPRSSVATPLTRKQIDDLGLDIYGLEGFDWDLYMTYYSFQG